MQNIENAYFKLIESRATPEQARDILPNSLKTNIVCAMNLRQWRHFLKLRLDKASHPQMREVARLILDEFQRTVLVIFDEFQKCIKT